MVTSQESKKGILALKEEYKESLKIYLDHLDVLENEEKVDVLADIRYNLVLGKTIVYHQMIKDLEELLK